jgi:hypothetical protein
MSGHDDDLMLRRLRGLAVLEPDATRTERARQRCHAVFAARQSRGGSSGANGRFRAAGLGALATLVAGLVVGMIDDVLRVYLRL